MIYACILTSLPPFAIYFKPCDTFVIVNLNRLDRHKIESLGYFIINDKILENFWKRVSQESSIRKHRHPQALQETI
jgi:hypothetical protein